MDISPRLVPLFLLSGAGLEEERDGVAGGEGGVGGAVLAAVEGVRLAAVAQHAQVVGVRPGALLEAAPPHVAPRTKPARLLMMPCFEKAMPKTIFCLYTTRLCLILLLMGYGKLSPFNK